MSRRLENRIRLDYKQVSSFGNISDDEDINRAWDNIKENMKPHLKSV